MHSGFSERDGSSFSVDHINGWRYSELPMPWHIFSGRTGSKRAKGQSSGKLTAILKDRKTKLSIDNLTFQTNRQKIMGPLSVTNLIIREYNLFLAFLIGIGFGFVLEQTVSHQAESWQCILWLYTVVLKVFFTAAITAMLGLLFFSLFGWIDLNLVYIIPLMLLRA